MKDRLSKFTAEETEVIRRSLEAWKHEFNLEKRDELLTDKLLKEIYNFTMPYRKERNA